MMIKPSTVLRNEYNEISTYCKEKEQPVFITKNGEGDLVVMSMTLYEKREEQLDLKEKLLTAELYRQNNMKLYSLPEANEKLKECIDGN